MRVLFYHVYSPLLQKEKAGWLLDKAMMNRAEFALFYMATSPLFPSLVQGNKGILQGYMVVKLSSY